MKETHHVIKINDTDLYFPFEPYETQKIFMKNGKLWALKF